MFITPLDQIKKELYEEMPSELVNFLPDRWEKIGNILIIKLNDNLKKYEYRIAKKYAEILHCKNVLNEIGGISGVYRQPKVKLLYGSKDTETIHIENGIKFKLDPSKIMFSSGNMDERIRMANISNKNETVIDLFAGIGYFTLPMAVYSKPKKIIACEKNLVAYNYLCDNILLNNVISIVEPLIGDSRKISPENIANRVIMGYINETHRFISTAIRCLKNSTGIIHYHDVFPNELISQKPLKMIQDVADGCNTKVNTLNHRIIKSYAPGMSHVVFDLKIGEK